MTVDRRRSGDEVGLPPSNRRLFSYRPSSRVAYLSQSGAKTLLLVLYFAIPIGPLIVRAGGAASDPVLTIHKFVATYAAARTRVSLTTREELLALSQGYQQYTLHKYGRAAAAFHRSHEARNTVIRDYALYLMGMAHEKSGDEIAAARSFRKLLGEFPDSPLAPRAAAELAKRLLAAGEFQEVVQLLEPYSETRRPKILWTLARAFDKLEKYDSAGELLETIHYEIPLSRESPKATKLLAKLRRSDRYRFLADTARTVRRLNELMSHKRTSTAYRESARLKTPAGGPNRGLVLLVKGKASYLVNRITAGTRYFRQVPAESGRIATEALFYLASSYRKLGKFDRFVLICQALRNFYPKDPFTERALFDLANHYLLKDQPVKALETYRAIVTSFPDGIYAAASHWKIVWDAYRRGQYRRAIDVIHEHLARFGESPNRRAALFWLGRCYLQIGSRDNAAAIFNELAGKWASDYYGVLAEKELAGLSDSRSAADKARSEAARRRLEQTLRLARPPAPAIPRADFLQGPEFRRIVELSIANLPRLAIGELSSLQALQSNDLIRQWIKVQLYAQLGDHWNSVRALSRVLPDYSFVDYGQLPREIWEILYPLDYWRFIQTTGKKRELDPFLVAALIRQESLFDPRAKSGSRARGLMQLIAHTGKRMARRLRLRFSTSKLYNANYNIQLGTLHLTDLMKRYQGRIHLVLAAYNGGESRVDRWLKELPRDDEEFVESIPITQTRNYVKRVISHWSHYRKLYSEPKRARTENGLTDPGRSLISSREPL